MQPTILVVEDEPLIALGLEAELSDAGYEVLGPVSSCAEAFTLLDARRPDCALLDVQLPDGSCAELARSLAGDGVPFVLTTGLRDEDLDEPFLHEVVSLKKPFDSGELLAAVRQMLPATRGRPLGRTSAS